MSQTTGPQAGRSTEHASFTIERTYGSSPAEVFAAWSDQAAKSKWFGPPEKPDYSLDFRIGGSEHLSIPTPAGEYSFDAQYFEILPEVRIVFAYDMHKDADRISVSLACVELSAVAAGTQMTYTEHGIYLDGHDTNAKREHGTKLLMDGLGACLGTAGPNR